MITSRYVAALISSYGLTILTVICQLLLVPLYLSHLGKDKLGVLLMIIGATNYAAVGIGWLSGGAARLLSEININSELKKFEEIYVVSKIVYVGYALAILLIGWLLFFLSFRLGALNGELILSLVLASVNLIAIYEYSTDRIALSASHRQALGNRCEIVGLLVSTVLIVLILELGGNLPMVIFGQITGTVTTRILAWRVWHALGVPFSYKNTSNFGNIWNSLTGKMGRDYFVYGAIQLSTQADILLIGWFAGAEVAATYYLIWRIPEVFILLSSKIPEAYAPFLIRLDAEKSYAQMIKENRYGSNVMLLIGALCFFLYWLLGPFVLNIWLGDSAPKESFPYLISATAAFFLIVSKWPSTTAYCLLNTRPLIKIAICELIIKIILIKVLISEQIFYAPAIAIAVAHGTLIFYLYRWLGGNTMLFVRSK